MPVQNYGFFKMKCAKPFRHLNPESNLAISPDFKIKFIPTANLRHTDNQALIGGVIVYTEEKKSSLLRGYDGLLAPKPCTINVFTCSCLILVLALVCRGQD